MSTAETHYSPDELAQRTSEEAFRTALARESTAGRAPGVPGLIVHVGRFQPGRAGEYAAARIIAKHGADAEFMPWVVWTLVWHSDRTGAEQTTGGAALHRWSAFGGHYCRTFDEATATLRELDDQ